MSEYQYYEFQAIDRPLDEADRKALRSLSSRAEITATSFTNQYEWGDFKGSPRQLMERWFDLHLHVAYWGTRRLMIRLPKRLIDQDRLDAWLMGTDLAELIEAGDNLILDIHDDREDALGDDGDDGSGWLAAMAPLRAELLAGDWRLAYLLWLTGVANGSLRDDAPEPLPGIAPLSGGLQAFADFLRIDPDLVQAAAEAPAAGNREPSSAEFRTAIAAMPESRKTALLLRLAEGDPHVAAELRSGVRRALSAEDPRKTPTLRSAASLRRRAEAIRKHREAAAAERRRVERLRRQQLAEQARRARLTALRRRGEDVWREIETEVARRNASGYDRATSLIADLRTLAQEDDAMASFANRLNALRKRHERKQSFIERLRGVT